MKKRFELVKTIQLVLFILITVAGIAIIFTDRLLYQQVGRNGSIMALCLLLWGALALSYVGIFWDFSTHSSFKKDYRELDYMVHNDRVTGMANRYSCDALIEKYVDRPLPDNIGSIMIDLSNLREINAEFGHLRGNDLIVEFSNILHSASIGLCFVGRNGGNKFLALFENATDESFPTFLSRIDRQVEAHNCKPDTPQIKFRTGQALSREEHVKTINELIALSDRRLAAKTDELTGFANRAACDDIIAQYLDKPMPEQMGCVMFNLSNIRQINEVAGRLEGNRAIRQFGDILMKASQGLCFIGRNGGTKFLALFEDCSEEKLAALLSKVDAGLAAYNASEKVAFIEYTYGRAFHEGSEVTQINQLIALADRRIPH